MADPTDRDIPAFAPAALAPRRDGWTADRQRHFIAALARTGVVARACAAAGISARSAYRLRARPEGAAFARAWDRALRTVAAHRAPSPARAIDLHDLSTDALLRRLTRAAARTSALHHPAASR